MIIFMLNLSDLGEKEYEYEIPQWQESRREVEEDLISLKGSEHARHSPTTIILMFSLLPHQSLVNSY